MRFFDWLELEQDFGYQLPLLGDVAMQRLRIDQGRPTGEVGEYLSQPPFQHRGSHCDLVSIRIRGSVLTMDGNPSRWGRLDNLFGFQRLDDCVAVFNGILRGLGLPDFTRCTRIMQRQPTDKDPRPGVVSDGAIIKRIDITSNVSVGAGNVSDYLAGLSTLRYRHSKPNLFTDGCTVNWTSQRGTTSGNYLYPSVYNKFKEIDLKQLPKLKAKFGPYSIEYNHLKKIRDYAEQSGIARFEVKLKSRHLLRHGLSHWGLFDDADLFAPLEELLNLHNKLQVTAMDYETIAQRLINSGACSTPLSANTTSMYAMRWMHGETFDIEKRQVKTHRARLRKIGIDIAQRCNISKFSPVYVVSRREVTPVELSPPDWYQMPKVRHLSAVA